MESEFDELAFKAAVYLLVNHELALIHTDRVAQVCRSYDLGEVNNWLINIKRHDSQITFFDDPVIGESSFEDLRPRCSMKVNELLRLEQNKVPQQVSQWVSSHSREEQEAAKKPQIVERVRVNNRRQKSESLIKHSCGFEDSSGLEGRYSIAIDFKKLYDDPDVFYGTWEETPPARRRFR